MLPEFARRNPSLYREARRVVAGRLAGQMSRVNEADDLTTFAAIELVAEEIAALN